MIKVHTKRNGNAVYINPKAIQRISLSQGGDTVIDIEGQSYSTWCVESPDEVYNKIEAAKQ